MLHLCYTLQPNIANRDGETPLHFIVKKMQVGQPLTMVRLLQGGANAGSKNSSGDTPLTLAARLNKIDAVSLLVDSCRQLAQDARPLIEAARTGRMMLCTPSGSMVCWATDTPFHLLPFASSVVLGM
eukprot:scpid94287/ scgid5723/ 